MWLEERVFLNNAVCEAKPFIALEIGTWKGGGSTLQIVNAITTYGGHLHTCETDNILYQEAIKSYQHSNLNQYISFYNKPSTDVINDMIKRNLIPQFIFFDGPEDSDLNLSDFKLLDQHLPVGTYFCMHDWDLGMRVDGNISIKALYLRPYLEKLSTWKILRSLTAPISVGIVLAQKVI